MGPMQALAEARAVLATCADDYSRPGFDDPQRVLPRIEMAISAAEAAMASEPPTSADGLFRACTAVLMFHSAPSWDHRTRKLWFALTGSEDATSKVLCDTVREAIARHGAAKGNGKK